MTHARKRFVLLTALAVMLAAIPVARTSSAAALPADGLPQGCVRPVLRTATPVGTTSCPGVRPGALLLVPSRSSGCTLGFIYSGSGRYYATTAGHCVLNDGQQAIWAEGKGPVVTDSRGKPFGRFVFAALRGAYDIGVILVTKGIVPKTSMCHFGGPTGRTDSRTTSTVILEHYGNGDGVSIAVPGRTGVAKGMPDATHVYGAMVIATGDSGGPVIMASSGKAVGYVTAIGYGFVIGGGHAHFGHAIVHRLGPQMAYAMKFLRRTLSLRTAAHSKPVV